jgi:ketosteroid isomerase-like protein
MNDAWNRRDVDALSSMVDPEIEFVNGARAVEPGTRRGLADATAAARAQWDVFLDAHSEIDQIFELGDEIISLGRLSSRMPGSEARISEPILMSYKTRDGEVTRIQVLGFGIDEVQETLRSLGLPG